MLSIRSGVPYPGRANDITSHLTPFSFRKSGKLSPKSLAGRPFLEALRIFSMSWYPLFFAVGMGALLPSLTARNVLDMGGAGAYYDVERGL